MTFSGDIGATARKHEIHKKSEKPTDEQRAKPKNLQTDHDEGKRYAVPASKINVYPKINNWKLLNHKNILDYGKHQLKLSKTELDVNNAKSSQKYNKITSKIVKAYSRNRHSHYAINDKDVAKMFVELLLLYYKEWNESIVVYKGMNRKNFDKLLKTGKFWTAACSIMKDVAIGYGEVVISFPKDSVKIGTPGLYEYEGSTSGFGINNIKLAEGRIKKYQKLPKNLGMYFQGILIYGQYDKFNNPLYKPYTKQEKEAIINEYGKYGQVTFVK